MQHVDALFASEAKQYFPKLTASDIGLLSSLPDEFCLKVPFHMQDSPQGSGSACLQMLCDFYGLEADGGLRALAKTEKSWKAYNHETLAEDFIRVAIKVGLLPHVYYPGRFVLPKFPEGYLGADFIARNISLISPFDRELMKAAIFASRGPLFARIHFATDEYKMPEEMAAILDTAGHGLLLCGWNRDGFLVHDPWNAKEWGGYGGGEYRLLTYKRLTEMKPLVNCCLEESVSFGVIDGFIRAWDCAVFENRDMAIRFQLESMRLPSYYYNYVAWDYSAQLTASKNIIVNSGVQSLSYADAIANQSSILSWDINTGPTPGSYPIEISVSAKGSYPVFPWETARRTESVIDVQRTFKARLDIKRLEWLNKYARV